MKRELVSHRLGFNGAGRMAVCTFCRSAAFAVVVCMTIGEFEPGLAQTTSSPYGFALPFQGRSCGGFCDVNGSVHVFQYKNRQLYQSGRGGRLLPREHVKGWYVVDVAVVDGQPTYCSRDRIFRKVRGKIQTQKIRNTQKLISIAADEDAMFLLDVGKQPTIVVLDKRTVTEQRRFRFDGRKPADLAASNGELWVLDRGDRCIHRVDPKTGESTLKLQAGPGANNGTNGLMVRDGKLYVHEGDFARLRRVDWQDEGLAVTSWTYGVRMTFVQESSNVHDRNTTTVTFKVPVPPERFTQAVGRVKWSQRPSKILKDRFGQTVARFDDIRIGPKKKHVLKYTVDIHPKAVQFHTPEAPLSSLDQIPRPIRQSYLASNRLYQLNDTKIKEAARQARLGPTGEEPHDVRQLIVNIAEHVIGRTSYRLDDSWASAPAVLAKGTGSCSEYSFLFSALCRLNKIPTRLVGGVQIGDYAEPHVTKGFHRWTEVWYPEVGWVPVDVTKIDGAKGSLDYEFLFGTPGYLLVLSQGDFDEKVLGMTYYINRSYRGGRRQRSNHVEIEPLPDSRTRSIAKLKL